MSKSCRFESSSCKVYNPDTNVATERVPESYFYVSQTVKLLAEGKIPPNATLMFEIELYAVTKGPRSIETFKQIDTDNDRQLSKAEVIQLLALDFRCLIFVYCNSNRVDDISYFSLVLGFVLRTF